ncbi:LTA synthase family protein [Alistipes senegalensis]|uniref:Sulfatase-like hydrolase/transferase n=1 Tax=Alistipes senegalensis JC50 TaxID=1033732 RepID=A0ABY5VBG0_9BACT|nr:alkaline phosphatase family protein [Alistipes senegalensis]UEA88752.1 sulfatase-like hydrolase/transferase [Alistipes senegalensis]UWN66703.1 sulfatase-like hydrolase/transferase [Alistipes senegalensis JC50]
MRRKLAFPIAVFAATVVMMAVQKPVFMAYYAVEAAGAGIRGWIDVLWHGLTLDMTVAGYVTALPILVTLLSLWLRLPEKVWRGVLTTWFVLVAVTTAVIFAVDVALYEHWGFRIDSTVLIYLADPEEAMASVDFWLGVRQTLLAAAYAAGMIWVYRRILGVFDGRTVGWRVASLGSLAVVMLAGFDFLAIRGGTGASVANVSKVYFSPTQFLNHAATNPVFSFLASLGDRVDYADEYPFFDEAVRAAKFDALRGNGPAAGPTEPVLNTARPNVVIVILESFARTVMDAEVGGEPVMPYMQRLKGEGIWFENFFANSFRTDRGEVAILSGFPAQTRMSIMKLPAKSRNLPSIARSLAGEGYATSFAYGGDLNFTNQSSYMYATGWQELIWQKDLRFDAPAADWGYDDALMCDWFADRVIALSDAGKPFLAGLLTLSSHTPFDVPYSKFDDKVLNAMAFSDECVGKMIDRLKASSAWKDLLVVLVADHGYPYPRTLTYNEPLRHRIPMIWTGGAVARPRVVEDYAAQIDIAATLLAQLGVAHDDFDYSKDIFAPTPPRKFAYYTFNDGFGVVDASGEAVWDATAGRAVTATNPELLDVGRTMLQTTYTDIGRR